jgi:hypothetical protein
VAEQGRRRHLEDVFLQRRAPVAVLSEADYVRLAAADGKVTVSTSAGSVTVPAVAGDIAEGVVSAQAAERSPTGSRRRGCLLCPGAQRFSSAAPHRVALLAAGRVDPSQRHGRQPWMAQATSTSSPSCD